MKKYIIIFIGLFCTLSDAHSAETYTIDTRKVADWNSVPGVVRVIKKSKSLCTGTTILNFPDKVSGHVDAFVITARHCVCENTNADCRNNTVQIQTNMDKTYDAFVIDHGANAKPDEDWALLGLSDDADVVSGFYLSDNVSENLDIYGFGDLRILSDQDIDKILEFTKKYQRETKTVLDEEKLKSGKTFTDLPKKEVVTNRRSFEDYADKITKEGIPGVAPIFGDGGNLKKSICKLGAHSDREIFYTDCFTYSGNSGGGIFNSHYLVGVVSAGATMSLVPASPFSRSESEAGGPTIKKISEAINKYLEKNKNIQKEDTGSSSVPKAITDKYDPNKNTFERLSESLWRVTQTDEIGRISTYIVAPDGNYITDLSQGSKIISVSETEDSYIFTKIIQILPFYASSDWLGPETPGFNVINNTLNEKFPREILERYSKHGNDHRNGDSYDGGKTWTNIDGKQALKPILTEQELKKAPKVVRDFFKSSN